MFPRDYLALPQNDDIVEGGHVEQHATKSKWQTATIPVLAAALLVSLTMNIFSCSRLLTASSLGSDVTTFARLTWNTPHAIHYQSQFNDPDRAVEDAAWKSDLVDPATLVVALSDSNTEAQNVSHSMRWPWDHTKGVYTLNSAHQLHCLHLLRNTVIRAYDEKPQRLPRAHTVHCLEYLLQAVMCYADDTPLYQGLLHANRHSEHPIGGLGDTRMCRSWEQLQTWAKQRSACYNPLYGDDNSTISEVERYKFCPDGSRPWEPA